MSTNRLWAIQTNGQWCRYAPGQNRWDLWSEQRKYIAADPRDNSSCFYIDPNGSVHHRNVDRDVNSSFPGIEANVISVGDGGKRLWAIRSNGQWCRYAPEHGRWDLWTEERKDICADPNNSSVCYFINPDGSVHSRNVDQDINKSYPGIVAKKISLGDNGKRLWAIREDGRWCRYAPEHHRWDLWSEPRLDIAAVPGNSSACYYVDPDNSVHSRNVDENVNKAFPGIDAKQISLGGLG